MKIGIDCRMYSSNFTGIGRYVYELVDQLQKIDHHNQYVLFFNNPEFEKFKAINPKNFKKVLVNAKHYSLKEQLKFLHILNRENLDLMHFTHFNAPIFYHRPAVVTIHDLTLHFFPGKKMATPFHRLAYNLTLKSAVKKAKKIITVSGNTKKDLQIVLRTPSQKIEVIYEGVHEKFKSIKESPQGKKQIESVKQKYDLQKPYILYTGVWRSHKNLPNLIRAFSILKKDYQYEGDLVITGRADPLYANEIYHLVADLNLTNDLKFTGMVEEQELVPLYNGAQLYIFPSLYEGFGLSPLEAMQCGVPTAVSATSCIPEVCGKDNSIYFDPNNPKDIAEKTWQIISSAAMRAKLIANGLAHVKKFSWQKMARKTLAVYDSISRGDTSAPPDSLIPTS